MSKSKDKKGLMLLPDENKADKRELAIIKRRVPFKVDLLDEKSKIKKHINSTKRYSYFYRHFETRFPIDRGDVFFVDFGEEGVGNELRRPHFAVALQNSNALNQMVTVVPFHSAKLNREPNPASELVIDPIPGVLNGKTPIAMINQTRTIDKRRLFDQDKIAYFAKYLHDDNEDSYKNIIAQFKYIYRLTKEQLDKITKAVKTFFVNGYISQE